MFLDDINGVDILELIRDTLQGLRLVQTYGSTSYRVNELNENDRELSGWIDVGPTGRTSSVVETGTGVVAHNVTRTQSDMIPLYFYFQVPAHTTEAYVALHKNGQHSPKTFLQGRLVEKFQDLVQGNFRFQMSPMNHGEALRQYIEEGDLKKIRFIKREVAGDVAENVNEHDDVDGGEEVEVEYSIKARRNKSLGGAVDWLNGKFGLAPVVYGQARYDELSNEFDVIKTEFKIGNKSRVVRINFNNPANIGAEVDLDGQIEIDLSGHPRYDSIEAFSKEYIDELVTLDRG